MDEVIEFVGEDKLPSYSGIRDGPISTFFAKIVLHRSDILR